MIYELILEEMENNPSRFEVLSKDGEKFWVGYNRNDNKSLVVVRDQNKIL